MAAVKKAGAIVRQMRYLKVKFLISLLYSEVCLTGHVQKECIKVEWVAVHHESSDVSQYFKNEPRGHGPHVCPCSEPCS